MKKHISLLIALTGIISLNAQDFRFGITGGMNLNSITNERNKVDYNLKTNICLLYTSLFKVLWGQRKPLFMQLWLSSWQQYRVLYSEISFKFPVYIVKQTRTKIIARVCFVYSNNCFIFVFRKSYLTAQPCKMLKLVQLLNRYLYFSHNSLKVYSPIG